MTQRDVVGRVVGGGFMFGNACKIKDFKIKKKKKLLETTIATTTCQVSYMHPLR